VIVYDIDGPLFFGAAQKAMGALGSIAGNAKVVVLRMDAVPAMDATGLVALESALELLRKSRVFTIISGMQGQPSQLLAKSELGKAGSHVTFCPDTESAISAAEEHLRNRAPSLRPEPRDAHAS
jgi:SulP family sulfate permease